MSEIVTNKQNSNECDIYNCKNYHDQSEYYQFCKKFKSRIYMSAYSKTNKGSQMKRCYLCKKSTGDTNLVILPWA